MGTECFWIFFNHIVSYNEKKFLLLFYLAWIACTSRIFLLEYNSIIVIENLVFLVQVGSWWKNQFNLK